MVAKVFVIHLQYKNLYREKKIQRCLLKQVVKFIKLYDWIKIVQENGVGEIYIFSIDNDGIDHEIIFKYLKIYIIEQCQSYMDVE